MTEQSIGDILNNEPAPEAPAEAPPEAETPVEATETPPETVERPRGPDGKFIAKETGVQEEPVPPTEQTDRLPQAEYAALKDERSKRQQAEDRSRQLEEQLRQFQQPQPQPQGPPDRWEDPEGYDQWLVGQATQIAREQAVHAVQQQRIYQSAVRARGKYEDYDQAHQVFGEMAQRNPSLFDQMLNADDPAEFAYRQARTEIDIRQYGSIDALVEARVKAREAESLQNVQQNLPPTISDSRSVGARSGPAWSGPAPLSELLR